VSATAGARVLAIDRLGAERYIAASRSVGRAGVAAVLAAAAAAAAAATRAADVADAGDFHRSFVGCSAMRRSYAR